jgi:hypothetical protein
MIKLKQSLIQDVKALQLSKKYEQNSIDLISLIMKKSYRKNRDLFSFVELSQSYFIKRYSNRFNEWLNKLIEAKILFINNSYKVGSYSKSYCINNQYLLDINNTYYIVVSTKNNKDLKIKELEATKMNISNLKIDYNSLKNIIKKHVDNLSINDFRLNNEIKENVFEVTIKDQNFEQTYFTSKSKAIEKAKELNKDLIQDKNRFLICDRDFFITLKKEAYNFAYNDSLYKLHKKYYHINRNATNQRLDSNLTNLCSILIEQICIDNDLIQIDLRNSQFAILSHIIPNKIKKYNDVLEFIKQSQQGTLYEYIQNELKLDSRKQSKQITFEVLFSSENNKSQNMKYFKILFPNLLDWINDFKSKNGYENFSIMLQKKESEIFIDGIFKKLIKQKLFALTKHDSIICKSNDFENVKEIITNYFNKIKFIGTI